MKISHTEVSKPRKIERVGIIIENIDLPTDFPTTFYSRREKSEVSSIKFIPEQDEEIVSDMFHVRVSHVHNNIEARILIPVYSKPRDEEEMVVKFILGTGKVQVIDDFILEQEVKYF